VPKEGGLEDWGAKQDHGIAEAFPLAPAKQKILDGKEK